MHDSVRKVVALALWVLTGAGASATCCWSSHCTTGHLMSTVTRDHGDAGLAALRAGNYVKAEHEFTKAGDDARLAEAFLRQDRYDEAELLVKDCADGPGRLMYALARRGKGDEAGYRKALAEARDLGSDVAEALAASEGAGG